MDTSSVIFSDTKSDFENNEDSKPELVYTSVNGYALIWKATIGGKSVCLKSLKPEFSGNPIYTRLLEKEYEIGSSINHPNINKTIDYRQFEGLGQCIVCEWIEGETLANILQKNQITPPFARKIILELCDALDALHHAQIVHHDLKPSNIMLTHNGHNVKLIDFGFADTDSYEILKLAAGTPEYAAPEQIKGSTPQQSSDIYALGKVIDEIRLALKKDGHFWKDIAAKCTAPEIKDRIGNVASLKQLIFKKERLRRQLPIIISTVALAIAIVFWICSPHIAHKIERKKIDNLVRELNEELLSKKLF